MVYELPPVVRNYSSLLRPHPGKTTHTTILCLIEDIIKSNLILPHDYTSLAITSMIYTLLVYFSSHILYGISQVRLNIKYSLCRVQTSDIKSFWIAWIDGSLGEASSLQNLSHL